jgi:hypothetical protein
VLNIDGTLGVSSDTSSEMTPSEPFVKIVEETTALQWGVGLAGAGRHLAEVTA